MGISPLLFSKGDMLEILNNYKKSSESIPWALGLLPAWD